MLIRREYKCCSPNTHTHTRPHLPFSTWWWLLLLPRDASRDLHCDFSPVFKFTLFFLSLTGLLLMLCNQSTALSLSFLLAPLIIANWINDCSCLCEEIWMDGVSFFNSTLVQVLWFAFSRSVLTLQLVLSAIQAQCNVGCIFEDALVMFFLVLSSCRVSNLRKSYRRSCSHPSSEKGINWALSLFLFYGLLFYYY